MIARIWIIKRTEYHMKLLSRTVVVVVVVSGVHWLRFGFFGFIFI